MFSVRATYRQSSTKCRERFSRAGAKKVGRPIDNLAKLVEDVNGLGGPDVFRDPTFSEAYEIAVQDERNTVRAQPVQLLTG